MKRMCAWCGMDMGTLPSEVMSENVITHGICLECVNKVLAEYGTETRTFLNRLAEPVVIVDGTGSVKTANKQAQSLLQKELPDIEGYRGGEVFQCIHAELPEGCGNTVHCSGCTIRRTIMDTYKSGKPHLKTPAYLNRGTPDNYRKVDFLISTEKVGGVVLLRIDNVANNEGH